jgi:hypothetical protein
VNVGAFPIFRQDAGQRHIRCARTRLSFPANGLITAGGANRAWDLLKCMGRIARATCAELDVKRIVRSVSAPG